MQKGRALISITTAACLALAAVACGTKGVNTTPIDAPATERSTTEEVAAPAVAEKAHVGSTIAVEGQRGETADVTLVQVIEPAEPDNPYLHPQAGRHYVGVQIRVLNTGTTTIDDSAHNDLRVGDAAGQTFSSTFAGVADCVGFASGTFTLAPGDMALGCVAFEVPDSSAVSRVQFGLNSGFGSETAQWIVP